MNYVFNPLIHLHYFQSCLIEYYDLCVHVLICILFSFPDLAGWPWSSLEAEKKHQPQTDNNAETHAPKCIKI